MLETRAPGLRLGAASATLMACQGDVRNTPPDWRADGWFLERRHPTGLVSAHRGSSCPITSRLRRRTRLVGVHDELRLARLARQKRPGQICLDRHAFLLSLIKFPPP